MPSPEARYAVYLADPGPDVPAVIALIREVAGVTAAEAAGCLERFPALICYCESEASGRSLARRFRELSAVAMVRPSHEEISPALVEGVAPAPGQRTVRVALLVLGVIQIGISALWLYQGRWATAVFGFLLAVYVLVYFTRSGTR